MKKILDFHNIIRELSLVKRPSSKIKSPYVADAIDKDNNKYLVHAPCLGLGEQCIENSKIYVTPAKSDSKTDYIIQSVRSIDIDYPEVIIGANPYSAELICRKIISDNIWNPYPNYQICKKPRSIDYNGDLYMKNDKGEYLIIEIKNVVCASYNPYIIHTNPPKRIFYDYNKPFVRSGIYPYGHITQQYQNHKVVSERSIRQLDFMMNNLSSNYQYLIIFLVNREDCESLMPNYQADPIYARYLYNASRVGVKLHALKVKWTYDKCYFDKEINIKLSNY